LAEKGATQAPCKGAWRWWGTRVSLRSRRKRTLGWHRCRYATGRPTMIPSRDSSRVRAETILRPGGAPGEIVTNDSEGRTYDIHIRVMIMILECPPISESQSQSPGG
jgi:hypothetical protein